MRDKEVEFSSSYQLMIYPKYMVINKSNLPILCGRQGFHPLSNDYLNQRGDKYSYQVPGYSASDSI